MLIVITIVWNLVTKYTADKWEDILFALRGKKITILGVREVGKTTLFSYITEKKAVEKYIATTIGADVKRVNLNDLGLDIRLKATRDVSGSEKDPEWENLVKSADIILYLVNSQKLLCKDAETEHRVEQDLNNIRTWSKGSRKIVWIIGNHWKEKQIPNCEHWSCGKPFPQLDPNEIAKYTDEFQKLEIVGRLQLLVGGAERVGIALGSLEDLESGSKLIGEVFKVVR